MKKRQYPVSVLALAILGIAIIIYGVLAGLHADLASYVSFVAPIVTVLIGLVVVSKQVDDVRDTASKVEDQTNGKMDAKFTDLKAHVDARIQEVKDNNNG